MDIIVERGAGLDGHKGSVVACVMGAGIKKEIRTYSTMTKDLSSQRMAAREPGNPGSYGEHRGLLEAGIQRPGRQF
jgi:hypothetical protein